LSALISSYRGWDGVTADHNYNWHDAMTNDATATPTCLTNSHVPCDDGFVFPHGTYTMGVTVGDDGATRQIGVSPGAKWIGCRSLDLAGGTPATYIECFQWLVAPTDLNDANPDPSLAPHVVNNSWACIPAEGCNPDTLQATVKAVCAAGIVVVAAAGNDGTKCETIDYPPAIYAETFTVGATDSVDVVGAISSRGPVTVDGSGVLKPDITAPGIAMTSAVGIWDIIGGGILWDYFSTDGTSASSPHVAGAVALLLQARPDVIGNVDAIETLLRDTALGLTSTQPCGELGPTETPNNVYGHGRLDLVNLFLGDADADGTTNVHDCALDDDTAWSLASGIGDLTLSGKPNTTLSWSQPVNIGANTFAYDVVRSDAAADFSSAFCVGTGQGGTISMDAFTPVHVAYYLVRTVNACGGSAGQSSSGAPRSVASCP
jgi:subtilisin family serine protease